MSDRVKTSCSVNLVSFVTTTTDSLHIDVPLSRTTEREHVHAVNHAKNNSATAWLAVDVTWLIPVRIADLSYHGLALAGFDARLQGSSIRDPAGARVSDRHQT